MSLVLCIYFDSAQTNPVAGFFVNFVKCKQAEIITKYSQLQSVYFQVTFFLPAPSSLLKLPIIDKRIRYPVVEGIVNRITNQ